MKITTDSSAPDIGTFYQKPNLEGARDGTGIQVLRRARVLLGTHSGKEVYLISLGQERKPSLLRALVQDIGLKLELLFVQAILVYFTATVM